MQLVDIKLYSDALQEAFILYLSKTGLRVTDQTEVTLKEDPERGVYAEVKNLALGTSPALTSASIQAPVTTQAPVPAQALAPSVVQKPTQKMVKMVDASAYEEGKLEETKIFEVPASRFAVDPVPKGEPPRMRGGVMEVTRPSDTNVGVDPKFHTEPVAGLKPSIVADGERGRLADLPDDL